MITSMTMVDANSAGYKGDAGDCLARAIVIATIGDYKTVYKHIAQTMKKHGYPASADFYTIGKKKRGKRSPRQLQDDILIDYGFHKVSLGRGTRPTYTEAHLEFGNCIVTTTKHFAALVDGAVRDTFDERTYDWWDDEREVLELRERKARSIWIR